MLSEAGRNNRQIYSSNRYYKITGTCNMRSEESWRRVWFSYCENDVWSGMGWSWEDLIDYWPEVLEKSVIYPVQTRL